MNEMSPIDRPAEQSALIEIAADIVSAYVSKNSLSTGDLPRLIADVYAALKGLSGPMPELVVDLVPAVSIKKSVTPDYIVCLEDGKKFKSLKRHLATHFNLSPEQYREKWSLPATYPMVAPNYAETRSRLAKAIGLGRKPAEAAAEIQPAAPKKRSRKSVAAE